MIPTQYDFVLTFQNHKKTVRAHSMKIDGKYIFFYGYVGDFIEAFRAKNVTHIVKTRIEG